MNMIVVEIDDKNLWEGCLVKNLQTGYVKTIRVLNNKTISQAVRDKEFDPSIDINYETFKLNINRFELV